MCTCKDTLAHSLGVPCLDDVMSFNSLTTYRWTIWKQDHSKSRHFSPNSEWFYTKWKTIVPILNGRVCRFQTTFENWTVPQPAYFLPFKSRHVQILDPQCIAEEARTFCELITFQNLHQKKQGCVGFLNTVKLLNATVICKKLFLCLCS